MDSRRKTTRDQFIKLVDLRLLLLEQFRLSFDLFFLFCDLSLLFFYGVYKNRRDTVVFEPNISSDGKWIVYENGSDGAGELWRMSINGTDNRKLTERRAEWPEISPDGKFIGCGLYIDDQVKLAILPIEGGEPVKTFDLPRLYNFRWSLHWTPDGKMLTYRDWANGIWSQNISGGEPKRLEGLPEEKLAGYGWSPDNKRIAFGRLNTPRDVVLIEDTTNK